MRIVEDLAHGAKHIENRRGFSVLQGGNPTGEKKTKKRPPKRRRYHPLLFALPHFTPQLLIWESHPHHKREREEEGKSRHYTESGVEKTANAAPHREGESAIVPSFCGGYMSLWWFVFSLHSLVFDGPCVSVYYLDGGDEPSPQGAPLKNQSGDCPPLSFGSLWWIRSSLFFCGISLLNCLCWEGKPRREMRPPPTERTRETERQRESEESHRRHKESEERSRHNHTRERQGGEGATAREVERRRSHHHQKEGTGCYPSLLWWLPSPCHCMVDTTITRE